MRYYIVEYSPWLISILTLYMMYEVGNKKIKGWIISFVVNFMWSCFIVLSETWGLIPLNIGMWILTFRNYYMWKNI